MSKSLRANRGLRGALRTGPPSITAGSLALGGAVLFGGTAYFSYRYANAHVALRDQEISAEPGGSFGVFDKIAAKYDEAIGQEEAALWYGMMRRWLLREAYGDVLEVSVGTGRNFQYYDLDKGIKSLTFTDLSPKMLLRAEDKFFDELNLGHKHPGVRTTFCLADAHCLVKPATVRKSSPAASASGAQQAEPAAGSSPWWAHWRRRGVGAPAQAGSSSTEQDSAEEAAEEWPTATSTASDGESSPRKEMAGLHATGLLNFFRILAPPSSSSKSMDEAQAADRQGQEVSQPQAPVADSRAQAHHDGVGSSGAPDNMNICCSTGPSGTETCGFAQRCNTGVTESGAALHRFAPGQFDTVVDTFGLCSHEDPVKALKEMARVCKPNGKVLLLEHGRSYYDWLNGRLDASAVDHQRKWGCLWNRDILAVVQQAGLQVDKVTRWHFGTSYYIVARPSRGP